MAINLLETIQQKLGFPPLQKIDPNTEDTKDEDKTALEDKFGQAAIPAVVVGIYRFVQSDEGALYFLSASHGNELLDKVFANNKSEVITAVAEYANYPAGDTEAKLDTIAGEVLKVVKENLPANAGIAEVKAFFKEQRNNILVYLPAALHMGLLLDDNTLDDNTNKMEGPISSFMNKLSNLFSKPVDKQEADKIEE